MRTIAVVAVLAAVVAAAARGPATVAAGELHFVPAPGWMQAATGMHPPAPQTQSVIAANVPILDPPYAAHADLTVRDLPADGIVITGSIRRADQPNDVAFPERSLPLNLADADVRPHFEAQPNPEVPEYLLWQRVDGLVLDVRVFFGSQEPDAAVLAEAQEELERLVIPLRESQGIAADVPGCVRYLLPDGTETPHFPAHQSNFHHCPVFETLPGWKQPLEDQLPALLQAYVEFVEQALEVPVRLVGMGAERERVLARS